MFRVEAFFHCKSRNASLLLRAPSQEKGDGHHLVRLSVQAFKTKNSEIYIITGIQGYSVIMASHPENHCGRLGPGLGASGFSWSSPPAPKPSGGLW